MSELGPEELESNLFEIVSLRNCDMLSITSREERLELAKLNLRAGMKVRMLCSVVVLQNMRCKSSHDCGLLIQASENAAFDSASTYFESGYELCSWDEDSSTMQKLCSEGACSCFINGDFEQMNVFVDEVLSKDFIPITRKNKGE